MNDRTGRRVAGFTLVELVITVAIVGLLASAAIPLASMAVRREKESDLRVALRQIRGAIDAYKQAADQGRVKTELGSTGYPPNLQVLVDGVEDALSPSKATIYFLRRLPRDPLFPDGSIPAAETWGLRSYSSPPDSPQAGDDVFDVYPLEAGKGLNGVEYREW